MHIIIQRDYLAQAVGQVSKAVSSRTTIPILTGIKLSVTHTECHLTGSDSDISIQSYIPMQVDEKDIVKVNKIGSVVLPAKYLAEIVKKLPDAFIEIEVMPQFMTMIRSGKTEFTLNGLDPDEYPRLPQIEEDKVINVSSNVFKNAVRQTAFAVSTQESRPILTGVMWQLNEGLLKLVATDSHRLAQKLIQVEAEQDLQLQNVVIPGRSLYELSRIIEDEDTDLEIVVSQQQILVRANHILFMSRLLDGTYPDTTRIIPQQSKTVIQVETKLLLQAIERASLLAKDAKHLVHLSVEPDKQLQITSFTPEVGKVVEELQANHIEGEELKISFNAKFVIDALRVIESQGITISFTGSMSPFIIRPQGEANSRILHLILPVRTY
jgi:DNA polymerase-3 subunit beta